MDYRKIIAMQQTLRKNGVDNNTETIISLGELACMYYTQECGSRIDNYGKIKLKENTEGILITWKLDTGAGNIYKDQRMIFKPDDSDEPCTPTEALQKRYDSISNISGLNEYRTFLKTYKDLAFIAEYESVTEKYDFKEHSKYVSTLSDSIWDIGKADNQYEYINDTDENGYRITDEIGGGYYAQKGLDKMTNEQISIYNYLYYYDKEEADEYITLIQPYLRTEKAYENYEEIKDSTFKKTTFEFGAGTESVITGIENCFGVNDDLDGIPMQTVISKVDGLIMSDAGTVESKIYGISKIGGALLPIAAVSVIPGAGGMAASGEIAVSIGTASAYGLSAGGNAYAGAKQEGYTDYQSKMYGTMAGVKETAKMIAFSGVSKIIPANGTGSLLKESLSIGATDAVIEFADETLVTPNMSAQILDNPELKEVNYKEALLNSLATGGMFAGIHLVGGTVKNIGNKLQEKKTAGNNDIALSGKEGNYANEQYLKNLEKIYDDIYSRQTEVNYEYEEFLNDINDCNKDLSDGIIADNVTKVEATENISNENGNVNPIETSQGKSSGSSEYQTSQGKSSGSLAYQSGSEARYKYNHNPSDNPKVLRDAIEDPNAVYGYRPREDGSLALFINGKWEDPIEVEGYRQNRIAYHNRNEGAAQQIVSNMTAEGASPEDIARAVNEYRNQSRINAYVDTNGNITNIDGYNAALERAQKNSYENLVKRGKTPEQIIKSATKGNPAMDACTGLYDEYFDTY